MQRIFSRSVLCQTTLNTSLPEDDFKTGLLKCACVIGLVFSTEFEKKFNLDKDKEAYLRRA